MARRNSDSGRVAIIWLATAYTMLIGAAAVGIIIVVSTDKPDGPLFILGSAFAGLILLMLLLSFRWEQPINQLRFWLSAQDRSDPTDDYRAARRRIKSREQFGENSPPSVESVRDAANDSGAWVPRSNSDRRPRKRS